MSATRDDTPLVEADDQPDDQQPPTGQESHQQPPSAGLIPYFQTPPKKGPTGLIIGVAAAGVAATLLLCCGGLAAVSIVVHSVVESSPSVDSDRAAEESATASTPQTPSGATDTATTTGAAPGLNTEVRDGDFAFVVTRVECGLSFLGDQARRQRARGQFCVVTLSVRNIAAVPRAFSMVSQKAYDASGTAYSTDTPTTGLAAPRGSLIWVSEINPGDSATGPLVFDLPRGKTLTRLKLHDSGASDGAEVRVA